MRKTCKNCKWWINQPNGFDDDWKICDRLLSEDLLFAWVEHFNRKLRYYETNKDFGCILWAKK